MLILNRLSEDNFGQNTAKRGIYPEVRILRDLSDGTALQNLNADQEIGVPGASQAFTH